MESIDMNKVHTDAVYRYQYLCKFMGFGDEDIAIIKGAAPLLAPVVPALVDAVYTKLFSFDVTKNYFVARQSGYEGKVPESMSTLSLDHDQIKFRKDMLSKYLVKLVTAEYDVNLIKYIDWVGKIHTSKSGAKSIDVDIVHMNALMGFVTDAVLATISSFNLPKESEIKAMRAFNKLLMIQNDFIIRHYVPSNGHAAVDTPAAEGRPEGLPAGGCPFGSGACAEKKAASSFPPSCMAYLGIAVGVGAALHAAFGQYFGKQ